MTNLKKLPANFDFETKEILKKAIDANKALAKLNGTAKIIPDEKILINSLAIEEAKDSSEIENIVTTHDELYKASINVGKFSPATKEVENYREALLTGFELVKKKKLLLNRTILNIQETLEKNTAGIRKQAGTVLKNEKTGEVIYTPPQNEQIIKDLLKNLEEYINKEEGDLDPLIKMAIIHYQFESIHPFYDGNGRTGRIINILYLVLKDLLDYPILYLSKYIINNKSDYYRLLQEVRTKDNWNEWVLYILDSIEKTSLRTIDMINNINVLMKQTKNKIRTELHHIYSKDLLEILFYNPYTKIDFLVDGLGITRKTASNYLKQLDEIGILSEIKIGNSKYFVNIDLSNLLQKGI